MEKGIRILAVVLAAWLVSGCMLVEKRITNRIKTTEPVSRQYAIEPGTIMIDDISVKYMEAGEGPWVVLIHGGVIPKSRFTAWLISPAAHPVLHAGAIATADSWNYNITELAENFHVVALDLPGFGGSDKPDIDYTLDDFVLYLDAFMQAKGIDKAMLVGHGLGGEIAMAYTLENPDKVDRLVLVDSFGGWGARYSALLHHPFNKPARFVTKYWQKEKAAELNVCIPLKRKMIRGWTLPAESAIRNTLRQKAAGAQPDNILYSKNEATDKFIESITEYKLAYITTEDSRKEVRAAQMALLETRTRTFQDKFEDIQAPVLLIAGGHDPIVTLEEQHYMEQALPRANMIVYDKSGHYPMVEEAERFNSDVTFFLSGKDIAEKQ